MSGILHIVKRVGGGTEGDIEVFGVAHGMVFAIDELHGFRVVQLHYVGAAHGDAAVTIAVGEQLHSGRAERLVDDTRHGVGSTWILVETGHIA